MKTSLGTYIAAILFIVVGGFLVLNAKKLASSKELKNDKSSDIDRRFKFLRIAGALILGIGLFLALGEWIVGGYRE